MNEGGPISIRIDYFVAGHIGRWHLFRPLMRLWSNSDSDAGSPETCLRFSRGQVRSADKLNDAYDYYRTVWTSVATASVSGFGISGVLIKAMAGPKAVNRVALALITLPWFFTLLVSVTLIGLGILRCGLSQYQAELKVKPKAYVDGHFQNGGNTDFFIATSVGFVACMIGLLAMLLAR